jgi:hypothetical protein
MDAETLPDTFDEDRDKIIKKIEAERAVSQYLRDIGELDDE